jgi:hypothetical protein
MTMSKVSFFRVRIRIHFVRIRIQGFDDQKIKKLTAETKKKFSD